MEALAGKVGVEPTLAESESAVLMRARAERLYMRRSARIWDLEVLEAGAENWA